MTKRISSILKASLFTIAVVATTSYSAFAMLDPREDSVFRGAVRGNQRTMGTMEAALLEITDKTDEANAEKAAITASLTAAKAELQGALDTALAAIRGRTMLEADDASWKFNAAMIVEQTRLYTAQVTAIQGAKATIKDPLLLGILEKVEEVAAGNLAFWDRRDERLLAGMPGKNEAVKKEMLKKVFAGRIFGVVSPYPENMQEYDSLKETLRVAADRLGIDFNAGLTPADQLPKQLQMLGAVDVIGFGDKDIHPGLIAKNLSDPLVRQVYYASRDLTASADKVATLVSSLAASKYKADAEAMLTELEEIRKSHQHTTRELEDVRLSSQDYVRHNAALLKENDRLAETSRAFEEKAQAWERLVYEFQGQIQSLVAQLDAYESREAQQQQSQQRRYEESSFGEADFDPTESRKTELSAQLSLIQGQIESFSSRSLMAKQELDSLQGVQGGEIVTTLNKLSESSPEYIEALQAHSQRRDMQDKEFNEQWGEQAYASLMKRAHALTLEIEQLDTEDHVEEKSESVSHGGALLEELERKIRVLKGEEKDVD